LPVVAARMNGWPTFLQRSLVEATARDEQSKRIVSNAFDIFNKKISWTQDLPGFISARIIAMIINEAYFTLAEKVSTKKEIDLALKLGTNYPYGPFEWAKQIGMEKISRLLEVLESEDERYRPAPFIKQETI
jgi:3-hydroxybutyryl-CoA dehydrogenase